MEFRITIPDDSRNAANLRAFAQESNVTFTHAGAQALAMGIAVYTLLLHDDTDPIRDLVKAIEHFRTTHPDILEPKEPDHVQI